MLGFVHHAFFSMAASLSVLAADVSLLSSSTVPSSAFCDPSVKHEFGYIQLPHKVNDHYFYSFFESRGNPAKDPLVVWLEGGPGSSSTWAMFNVNGPCTIRDDLNGTTLNPYSWTKHANVLWLDQPTGVGFSYGDAADDDSNEIDVGRNFYAFMQGWLKQHPQFKSNPFFITGQSYAGHYVPAAAAYIVEQKTRLTASSIYINLQGIAIGNGLTDTVTQMASSLHMAVNNSYNTPLVSPETFKQMSDDAVTLVDFLNQCQAINETDACFMATQYWAETIMLPMTTKPTRNIYDLREVCKNNRCNDYGAEKTKTYLNLPAVQARLGVHKKFEWSNDTVHDNFSVDFAKSTVGFVPAVLAAGVRVLVYAGDADLMCDWIGNDAWTKKLEWPGAKGFNAAPTKSLKVAGKKAGEVRTSHELSFVRVYNAGHMVPSDQPEVALALINRFFKNAPLDG
ncbi:Aste57867_10958 [Aphanomyces stellatus]|uniref:Aste57867_10958 protein n=1 Tax=Aphanomyces stellatus TaxID=120398 RepID=A0A485KS88_9STRA|nr:hypothetical protein As57867_010918 [Aphanomyces stellatus]VFT87826.1 Aste57867_10958 [Aphanomyces stellatus]